MRRLIQIAKQEIEFPGWENIIKTTIIKYFEKYKDTGIDPLKNFDDVMSRLKMLRQIISNEHPAKVLDFVSATVPEIDEKANAEFLKSVIQKVSKEWTGPNEFYVLFDIKKCDYVYVDERIRTVLGIEPHMFNIKSISALDEDCPLFHSDDLSHVVRFAILALMMMSLPFLRWNKFKEHYIARYRMGTSISSIGELRKKGYVTISKMCYSLHHPSDVLPATPRYHIDRYYVYSDEEIGHVTRSFVSDFEQTIFMNTLHYLFNSFLVGLSPKYVCMLEERRNNDRNKAVANAMNAHLRRLKGLDNEFDELQMANCFAKTIRSKIESAMNESDRFFFGKNIHIQSDQEAAYYAARLGLLPLPEKIRDEIFLNIRKII